MEKFFLRSFFFNLVGPSLHHPFCPKKKERKNSARMVYIGPVDFFGFFFCTVWWGLWEISMYLGS